MTKKFINDADPGSSELTSGERKIKLIVRERNKKESITSAEPINSPAVFLPKNQMNFFDLSGFLIHARQIHRFVTRINFVNVIQSKLNVTVLGDEQNQFNFDEILQFDRIFELIVT